MIAAIRNTVQEIGGHWGDYLDGEWGGSDLPLPDGGALRLAREGGEGEPVMLFRFDEKMMLEWQASFSADTPAEVMVAAVRAATVV